MNEVPKKAVQRQVAALIPVYMNAVMFGCAVGWLPNAIHLLLTGEKTKATSFQCALIASFTELGRFIFAIPSGILTDKYGRKKITICAAFLNFIAWIAVSLNASIIMIYIGRFVIGLALAMISTSAPISIGEISSPNIRGRFSSMYVISTRLGGILTSIINLLFSSSYNLLSFSITFLSAISLLPMYWMKETPSYLISVSKPQEAEKTLKHIRKGYKENEINREFEQLNSYILKEKTRKNQLNWIKFLTLKTIRTPLIIGTSSTFLTALTRGGIVFGSYITIIFPSNEYLPKMYYPLIGQMIAFILAICVPFYIDRFPRRRIILLATATLVITNATCMFVDYLLVENPTESVFTWILILGNIVSGICFEMVLLPITTALRSELFPQAVKGLGGSLAIMGSAMSSIIVFQLYMFFYVYSYLYYVYAIYSMVAFVLFLELFFFLPEGCGVSLPDLQMKFEEKPAQCEVGVEKN